MCAAMLPTPHGLLFHQTDGLLEANYSSSLNQTMILEPVKCSWLMDSGGLQFTLPTD